MREPDNIIYLNNAATSFPKPKEVVNDLNEYLNGIPLQDSRVGFEVHEEDVIFICRKRISHLINASNPSNIIFTSGATESLNLAIYGLDLYNKHVITTTIEHNSVLRPLKSLERDGIIQLSIIPSDSKGFIDPEYIAKEINNNTSVIIVNHCSNVTGEILDLEAISEVAHSNNLIFIVDASQSAGIVPIDVNKYNIDILAITGHKLLYGIPGIGAIYIREGLRLKPLKVGGTGIKSELLYQPEEIPLYYEAGTKNIPGIISLNSGIDFVLKNTIGKIKNKIDTLFKNLITEFKKISNITIYGREDTNKCTSIFSFNIKGIPPSDVGYILESSFGIIVRSGLHCAPLIHKGIGTYPQGSVRASSSYFTTDQDIDIFINAIRQICNGYHG